MFTYTFVDDAASSLACSIFNVHLGLASMGTVPNESRVAESFQAMAANTDGTQTSYIEAVARKMSEFTDVPAGCRSVPLRITNATADLLRSKKALLNAIETTRSRISALMARKGWRYDRERMSEAETRWAERRRALTRAYHTLLAEAAACAELLRRHADADVDSVRRRIADFKDSYMRMVQRLPVVPSEGELRALKRRLYGEDACEEPDHDHGSASASASDSGSEPSEEWCELEREVARWRPADFEGTPPD